VLTVTGDIAVANEGTAAVFDLDMLRVLPAETIRTTTIWITGELELTGVPLNALPALRGSMGDLRAPFRAMALGGVQLLAVDADHQRDRVVELLTRLVLVTTGLVVLLLVSLAILARLNRDMGRRTRALEMTTSRLCATVSSAIDAVVVADGEGRILDFNPAAEAIFGFRRDEVIGRCMDGMIVPESVRLRLQAGMERFRETGE